MQDKIKQAFRLPLDRVVGDSMDELTLFIFLLLSRWCLHYTQEGRLGQQEVFACLKRFMVGD